MHKKSTNLQPTVHPMMKALVLFVSFIFIHTQWVPEILGQPNWWKESLATVLLYGLATLTILSWTASHLPSETESR